MVNLKMQNKCYYDDLYDEYYYDSDEVDMEVGGIEKKECWGCGESHDTLHHFVNQYIICDFCDSCWESVRNCG